MKIKKYYKEEQYIRYSNCHEDADFSLKTVKDGTENILSIASALDNALMLLTKNPKMVTAIDFNDTQIYLCELKKNGIKHLEYDEFLILIGIVDGDSESLYNRIKPFLSEDARDYFDRHMYLIKDVKLIHCGRFEYYFSVFKNKILPKMHSIETIVDFMTAPDLKTQKKLYLTKFNNRRFALLVKLFFSQFVMKRIGRDKAFFKYSKGSLSDLLKKRFEMCIENNLNKQNPYIQYIMFNQFIELPPYLVKKNFDVIKKNIDSIQIRKATFSDVIKEQNQYDYIYLSDIFEYMSADDTASLSVDVYNALNPGGRVLLYNMMNERHLSYGLKEYSLDQSENRTFYYMSCYLYEKE